MQFKFDHYNYNVLDLERSVRFYQDALGLKVLSENKADDGSYQMVFMGDGATGFQLELTWLQDWKEPYNLGDNEVHLCFVVDDYDAAHQKHKDMGCVCFENEAFGIYFIEDPDGYWLEIVPER